jgi:hypothetical protein
MMFICFEIRSHVVDYRLFELCFLDTTVYSKPEDMFRDVNISAPPPLEKVSILA